MKSDRLLLAGLGLTLALASAANAGEVSGLTTFASGTTALASEVNDNFTAVKAAVDDNDGRVAALEAKIAALEALLAGVTRETVNNQPAVRFSGVNLQVVNGTGNTESANGTGNLIIGYDEVRSAGALQCSIGSKAMFEPITKGTLFAPVIDEADCTAVGGKWSLNHKSGSHYLVVGTQHNYSRWGGIVVGASNTSNFDYASVSGGAFNTASGPQSSVSGGTINLAAGPQSSVSGGTSNTASGTQSSVSGGAGNTAAGQRASVSGGLNRSAPNTNDWAAGTLFEED